MVRQSRRRFLAVAGIGLAGVAGCGEPAEEGEEGGGEGGGGEQEEQDGGYSFAADRRASGARH